MTRLDTSYPVYLDKVLSTDTYIIQLIMHGQVVQYNKYYIT